MRTFTALLLATCLMAAQASPLFSRHILQAGGAGGAGGGGAGGAGAGGAGAGGGGGGTQQLPQFLLPPVPPTAQAQVNAVVTSLTGNVNSFANAVANAQQAAGPTGLAVAFSDLIARGQAPQLLNTIATATAFGHSNIANYVNEAFGRAVSDQIARGDVKNAATAIAAAFTLAGGIGPALSTTQALANIVTSVGCTAPLSTALSAATQQVSGSPGQSPYAGLGSTFAYSVAQNPSLSGCWTTVGGNTARQLLASIQPVVIVGQQSTAPSGSVNPQSTGLPPNLEGPGGLPVPQQSNIGASPIGGAPGTGGGGANGAGGGGNAGTSG